MLRTISCLTVVASTMAFGMVQAQDKSDEQLLQGTWKVVVGEAADKGVIVGDLLTFAGDKRLTFQKERGQSVANQSATFSVDPTKKPKAFDLHPDKKPVLGIYELSGDRLKMYFSRPGQPRPMKFDHPGTDSIFLLVELERQK